VSYSTPLTHTQTLARSQVNSPQIIHC